MSKLHENLRVHQDCSVGYAFLAATDYSTASVKIPAKTGFTIYLCSIQLSVTTDHAATQTFQDTAGTPVEFAGSKATPGRGPIFWDFGPNGVPLTADKGLSHKMSAAGMAGSVSITAYYKKTPNVV